MSLAVRGLTPALAVDGSDELRRATSRALHPATGTIDPDVLSAIASGLAAVTLPWELRTGDVPHERRYERLLSTPAYEAWVICWPPGTQLELHDHGASAGAFTVVAGRLDEVTVERGALSVSVREEGATSCFGPTYVHAVANTTSELATSVHVYAPPLRVMDYYDRADDGTLVAIRRDAGEWGIER